jgi:hypothetical protein
LTRLWCNDTGSSPVIVSGTNQVVGLPNANFPDTFIGGGDGISQNCQLASIISAQKVKECAAQVKTGDTPLKLASSGQQKKGN